MTPLTSLSSINSQLTLRTHEVDQDVNRRELTRMALS